MNYSLRIFVSIIVVLGLGFWGYGHWLMKEIRSQYAQTMEESLVDFSNVLASYLSAQSINGELNTQDFNTAFENFRNRKFQARIHGRVKNTSPIHAYVTDHKGILVFDSRDASNVGQDYSRWNDVHRTLSGEYGARSTRTDSADPLSSVFYVAAPIQFDEKIIGVVSVIKPEQSLQAILSKGRDKFFWMGFYIIMGASLVAVLFSYWLTRPIQALQKFAKKISKGEKVRPPKTYSREFNDLGQAFDEMRISLEGKRSVENFVQHLTHELKSPLTAIRGAAEVLRDKMSDEKRELFISNVETESNRAKRLLDELLTVAALESRSSLKNIEQISIVELLESLEESNSALIEKKKLRFEIDRTGREFFILGEALLIEQALSNLLLNAIEFSPTGGRIKVELDSRDEDLKIIFRDQGPGVPDYARSRIFEKFYSLERPDSGKKSSGLGLSFVQEVVSLHSGSIVLIPSTENMPGASFLISLKK